MSLSRDAQQRIADISFILMGIVGAVGLFANSFEVHIAPIAAENPWVTGAAITALMIAIAFIITKVTALDRKCSEEYTFQLLASGAVVSVMTTLLVTFAWSNDFLLGSWLGEPGTDQILALMLGSWSVGYLTYRLRGIS